MEEPKDLININEIIKYLKAYDIDENIAEGAFLKELFDIHSKSDVDRFFVYYDEDANEITSRLRDTIGHVVSGPKFRIKKEGKTVEVEELSSKVYSVIDYGLDGPEAQPQERYSCKKDTFYLDCKGITLLAKEEKSIKDSLREVTEEDLYTNPLAQTSYEVHQDNINNLISKEDLSSYNIVNKICEITELEKSIDNLKDESKRKDRLLEKSINFIQKVKNSEFGKHFFKKGLKEFDERED